MLRSSLCDYCDAYMPVKGTITAANNKAQNTANNSINKKVIFKKYVPFINCITRINNK